MAEIKWIKLDVGFFGDDKIKQIRAMPEGDAMLLIWLNLLVMAGKTNDGGLIYLTQGVPYNDEMLSVAVNHPVQIVRCALDIFRTLRMVEDTPDGLLISNWEKHQNIDGMDRAREQSRQRMRRFREKERALKLQSAQPVCAYCGGDATGVDHIVALKRGGTDDDENKVPCCIDCNRKKTTLDLATFLNYNREKIRDDLIAQNKKLRKFVTLDTETNRYVTQRYATDRNEVTQRSTDVTRQNKKEDIEKEEEYKLYAPPLYDTEKGNSYTERAGGGEIEVGEGVSDGGRNSGRTALNSEAQGGRARGAYGERAEADGTGLREEPLDWRDLSKGRLR